MHRRTETRELLLYLSAANSKKRGSIVVRIVDLLIEPLHCLPNEHNKCALNVLKFDLKTVKLLT